MHDTLRERWPALALPHVSIGTWPTPTHRVPSLAGDQLWVKEEGFSAPEYGGNKIRKLEYILGDARSRGLGDLVTVGGVGSHHVIAMALHARRVGLRPWAALYPQPDSPAVQRNARLIDALCEDWTLAEQRARVPAAWLRAWGGLRLLGRTRPYIVPAGGSSALGTVGWVAGGLEIAESVAQGEIPSPRHVVVALGSGGTAAGLALGLRLGGLETEVVAVRAVDRAVGRRRRVRRIARETATLLQRAGASITKETVPIRVEDGYAGEGYGRPLAGAADLRERAEAAGLGVDDAYTLKALAAAIDLATCPGSKGPVLYVSTVNRHPLDELLREALPEVPRSFLPLLTT